MELEGFQRLLRYKAARAVAVSDVNKVLKKVSGCCPFPKNPEPLTSNPSSNQVQGMPLAKKRFW